MGFLPWHLPVHFSPFSLLTEKKWTKCCLWLNRWTTIFPLADKVFDLYFWSLGIFSVWTKLFGIDGQVLMGTLGHTSKDSPTWLQKVFCLVPPNCPLSDLVFHLYFWSSKSMDNTWGTGRTNFVLGVPHLVESVSVDSCFYHLAPWVLWGSKSGMGLPDPSPTPLRPKFYPLVVSFFLLCEVAEILTSELTPKDVFPLYPQKWFFWG